VSLAVQYLNVKNDAPGKKVQLAESTISRQIMRDSPLDDFMKLDDPSFLDERARLRGLLADEPDNEAGREELQRRYDAMTEEFCRRARISWAKTT
jgi:hypothetical protein